MNGAAFAMMSDPTRNPQFRRRWSGPPEGRSPAMAATIDRARPVENLAAHQIVLLDTAVNGSALHREAIAWLAARRAGGA
jgi:hypothetical protein